MSTLFRKDILVYFGGKIVPAILNFALIILAMRWLGSENYGKYSLIYYAVMLVSTFTFGWIQQSTLRFQNAYKLRLNVVSNRFFILTILSSLIGTVFLLIACPLYYQLGFIETITVTASFFLYNILLFQLTNYQARFKSFKYAITESIYNILMFSAFIVLVIVAGQRSWLSLFIAMIAGFIIVDTAQLYGFVRKTKRTGWSHHYWNKDFTRQMLSYGFMMSVWLSVSYLFNIVNRFVIKEYCGYEEVGIFSSIYDIIYKIAGFICMPILLTYHPRITNAWNEGLKNHALKDKRNAIILECLIFIVIFCILMAGKNLLFEKVLKLNTGPLTVFTAILTISAFGWQIAMMVHKPLELLLRIKEMIYAILISLIINVAGNIVLIPRYGFEAAAWCSLAGVLSYMLITHIMSVKYMKKENHSALS